MRKAKTGADHGDTEDHGKGNQVNCKGGMLRKEPLPSGTKTEDVHGNRKRLGYEEGNTDAPSHLQAEGLGNDIEGSPGPDADVGGDGRQGEAGKTGYGKGEDDDQPGTQQSGVSYHPPLAEVHDDPQDGQQGRGKDPSEGAEETLSRFFPLLFFYLFFQRLRVRVAGYLLVIPHENLRDARGVPTAT